MTGRSRRRAPAATDGISDDAVAAATGMRWQQWYEALDQAGAGEMTHPEIARWLAAERGLSPWWSQMVTVAYERARGRRQVHEKADGFSASVSRTLSHSARALFDAWADEAHRSRWLGDAPLTPRTATPHRALRFGWSGGRSVVSVSIIAKSAERCQLVVQHDRLASVADVARMKTFWAEAIDRLRSATT